MKLSMNKYIVFRAIDNKNRKYYIFGIIIKGNDIEPMFSFYTKQELYAYLTEYNKKDVLLLIEKESI